MAISIAGGIGPMISSGLRCVAESILAIRSSVGVTTGNPSDHGFSRKNSNSSNCWVKGVPLSSWVLRANELQNQIVYVPES